MNATDEFILKLKQPTLTNLKNCKSWFGSNDPLFSLFQTVILVAFAVPANLNIVKYLHKLFFVLGYGIGLIWIANRSSKGWNYDFWSLATWYGLFLIVNGFQLINMLVQRHFNQIPRHLFDLYSIVFQPLGVTPRDFLDLSKVGTILILPSNYKYAVEGSTRIGERISILLSGKLKVTFVKTFLHEIEPNEFIDSVEFKYSSFYCLGKVPLSSSLRFSINGCYKENEEKENHSPHDTGDVKETDLMTVFDDNGKHFSPQEANIHQVTIISMEPSKIITWDVNSFVEFMDSHDRLKSVIDACIGRDIIHKLYGPG